MNIFENPQRPPENPQGVSKNGKVRENGKKWIFAKTVIILVVFSTCSHFGTPPEPPFRVRADPGWAQAGAQECVFPTCVRHPARAPARALSPTAFAVKGGRGVSVPPPSQTLPKEYSIQTDKICWDAETDPSCGNPDVRDEF